MHFPLLTVNFIAAQANIALIPALALGLHSRLPRYPSWDVIISKDLGIETFASSESTESTVSPSLQALLEGARTTQVLLQHPTHFRACLTIDESADICFVRSECDTLYISTNTAPINSHDCGPGLIHINYAMRYCTSNRLRHDEKGGWATLGHVNWTVVDRVLDARKNGIVNASS